MPNTPAAIGQGVTALFANAHVSAAQRRALPALMAAVGAVHWIDDEELMHAITAMSGGGPAYVFLLIETLARAGIAAAACRRTLAWPLARATVAGSGALAASSERAGRGPAPERHQPGRHHPGGARGADGGGRHPAAVRPGDRGRHAPLARAGLSRGRGRWPNSTTPTPDLLVAAFALIAERGLARPVAGRLGARAGVPPVEVYREFRSRAALLGALSRRLDEAMLAVDDGRARRPAAARPGVRAADAPARGAGAVPAPGSRGWRATPRAIPAWCSPPPAGSTARSPGCRTSPGCAAPACAPGSPAARSPAAYLQTLRVWLEDEGADLGTTMAELDKQLRRVQNVAGLREPRARRRRSRGRGRPARVSGGGHRQEGRTRWPSSRSRTTFADLTKMMSEYQVPGVDWQELMAAQQKNLQALTKANQVLVEGAQAVMRREVEILQKAMAEFAEASKEMMQQGDPQAQANKRLELAKTSFEAAIANMRELAEVAGRSNREALEVINQRALESFEEIKQAMAQKRKRTHRNGAGRS